MRDRWASARGRGRGGRAAGGVWLARRGGGGRREASRERAGGNSRPPPLALLSDEKIYVNTTAVLAPLTSQRLYSYM